MEQSMCDKMHIKFIYIGKTKIYFSIKICEKRHTSLYRVYPKVNFCNFNVSTTLILYYMPICKRSRQVNIKSRVYLL